MKYTETEIADRIYKKLKKLPVGTEISVTTLGRKYLQLSLDDTDWWKVMDALEKVVKEDGKYRMDYSRHQGLTEGLPYNLDFVFAKKGQCIHRKESRVAKDFATANDIYGVHFLTFYCGWCVFETVSPPGILVDPAWPPIYIIVEEDLKARWSTDEEGEEIFNWLIEQRLI